MAENGLVGKGNLRILYGDDHAFYKSSKVDDLTLASTPQTIFGLYTGGSVCVEAGDMLLEKAERDALRIL